MRNGLSQSFSGPVGRHRLPGYLREAVANDSNRHRILTERLYAISLRAVPELGRGPDRVDIFMDLIRWGTRRETLGARLVGQKCAAGLNGDLRARDGPATESRVARGERPEKARFLASLNEHHALSARHGIPVA